MYLGNDVKSISLLTSLHFSLNSLLRCYRAAIIYLYFEGRIKLEYNTLLFLQLPLSPKYIPVLKTDGKMPSFSTEVLTYIFCSRVVILATCISYKKHNASRRNAYFICRFKHFIWNTSFIDVNIL
jgi:hypothetical protein